MLPAFRYSVFSKYFHSMENIYIMIEFMSLPIKAYF